MIRNEIHTLRNYLKITTDHTARCLAGMIAGGEITRAELVREANDACIVARVDLVLAESNSEKSPKSA